MPKPNSGESRGDFVARCVPIVMREGLTQEQAVGKCEGIYDGAKKAVIAKALQKALTSDEPWNELDSTDSLLDEIGQAGEPIGALGQVEWSADRDMGTIDPDAEGSMEGAFAALEGIAAEKSIAVAFKSALTADKVQVDANQLYLGTCEEMKHTPDWKTAMKIALDNLQQDPAYYDKLDAAGLAAYDRNEPHTFELRKSDRTHPVAKKTVLLDAVRHFGLQKAGDRWKNPDGTFKGGFDGCVAYAKASPAAGGRGLPEDRAKALCAYIARRKGT